MKHNNTVHAVDIAIVTGLVVIPLGKFRANGRDETNLVIMLAKVHIIVLTKSHNTIKVIVWTLKNSFVQKGGIYGI